MKNVIALAVVGLAATAASAQVRISEWMYQGNNGEFIEIVNIGNAPVSMSGWSFDDDSRQADTVDLTSLGTLAPGEAAVITESAESDFRAAWGLAASVKIFGGNGVNLGRNDEINIFDGGDNLVDRLTFGDQNFPGTLRTQNKSGWNSPVGSTPWGNVDATWVFSANGDPQNSHTSAGGDVGSPGSYVPAPGAAVLAGAGLLVAGRRRR